MFFLLLLAFALAFHVLLSREANVSIYLKTTLKMIRFISGAMLEEILLTLLGLKYVSCSDRHLFL